MSQPPVFFPPPGLCTGVFCMFRCVFSSVVSFTRAPCVPVWFYESPVESGYPSVLLDGGLVAVREIFFPKYPFLACIQALWSSHPYDFLRAFSSPKVGAVSLLRGGATFFLRLFVFEFFVKACRHGLRTKPGRNFQPFQFPSDGPCSSCPP